MKGVRSPVVVAMSGGLDSSVTAMLLKQRGLDVIGVFMSNWNRMDEEGSETKVCPSDQDYADVQEVCAKLRIGELHFASFQKEYWNDVFTPCIDDFSTGLLTPNPDVDCNRHIKFDYLRRYINEHIGEYTIATGHYARSVVLPRSHTTMNETIHKRTINPSSVDKWKDYRAVLLTGQDSTKDQSYFLSTIREEHLRQYIFPIGGFRKSQVRKIANAPTSPLLGANALKKKESMGICFIGKRPLPEFLSNYLSPTPGRFIDIDNGVSVGTHSGVEYLTCGQRARIGGLPGRYFICKKVSPATSGAGCSKIGIFGDVLVCQGASHPALLSDYLLVAKEDMKLISGDTLLEICINDLDNSKAEYYCKARSYSDALRRCAIEFVDVKNRYSTSSGSLITICSSLILKALRANADCAVCALYRAPSASHIAKIEAQLGEFIDETAMNFLKRGSVLENVLKPTQDNNQTCNSNDTIIANGNEDDSYPLLECLGGGKIHSAGPSYWEQGKQVPQSGVDLSMP